jgi:hypothetical protein
VKKQKINIDLQFPVKVKKEERSDEYLIDYSSGEEIR